MNLGTLVASLPAKNAAVYTFDRGKPARYAYSTLAADVTDAVTNLRRWGARTGMRIGIFAPNCYRWLVYDLAIIDLGAISVPFTDDFAGKIDRELLDKYQVSLLLIAKNSAQSVPEKQPYIAYIDADNENVRPIERLASPDDAGVLTLAFSSGSAGGLKGLVVIRQGVESTLPPICEAIGLKENDRLLLFLPMSSFQQRGVFYSALWYGADIILTDYVQLPASIKQLQPTVLIAPPMYYQMVYTRFINFSNAKKNFWTVLGNLISLIPGAPLRRAMATRLFGEFYQQFGGKIRVLITGMAPIKRDVVEFFNRMQLPLCESYGLMETGSLTYRPARSRKYGSVGRPLRGVKIEFTDEGEIIVVREKPLTRHYFQSAEGENERTFIGPGRVATGDIGTLDNDGYLYLMGRKKELIITPGGYKIHPEIVEGELSGCADIAQAAVFLKQGSATLVGVVSLNRPESEEARARIRDFVRNMKTTKVTQIEKSVFAEAPFSVENGLLRPNLKLDRRKIAAKYNLA